LIRQHSRRGESVATIMVQDPVPLIGRTLAEATADGGLEQYLDDHLIRGWRESLVTIGIKAENGDAEARKFAEAFGDWVFALCRDRTNQNRKSALRKVVSMTEFAEARRAPRQPE
jgi:hypothetical protein